MIVLSLFDGMACGYEALKRAGIPVTKYYAAEVDKYAMQIAKKNHPDIIHLGDVTKWREWDIETPDLIIGGSPCQGFSFAGKQLAFNDPRSALFFEYVNILRHNQTKNPNLKFLLENVKMKKEYLDIISEQLGVDPVCINSALVSAQNRVRYYWCNWSVEQPEDKGIFAEHILEPNIEDFEGESWHKWFKLNREFQIRKKYVAVLEGGDKAITMTSRQFASWNGNFTKSACKTPDVLYRKLTPVECERLQTLPDNYTEGVSNTQRYKMLGNGWTVDVIAHLFSSMKQGGEDV